MDYYKLALKMHEENKGKIAVQSKVRVENKDDLATAYTPGVAKPCLEIKDNVQNVYRYTAKSNLVMVLSDGSAVLGLGNIGAEASIPVMEGKCVLFKEFGNVDAFPICLSTQNTDEIVEIVKNISPVFGGINLEDIAAPRCFEIEEKLQKRLSIPVFHDDQHGTAIVACAALINALKIVGKKMEDIKIVLSGAGAAGTAIAKMLLSLGARNIIACDRKGILSKDRSGLNETKLELAMLTNKENRKGTLEDAMRKSDVFIGVSAPNLVDDKMIKSMNRDAIIFPMANPTPEIMPDLALKAGARIVGTGRSDFPNQINNVLAFPGIFRGALDVRAERITEEMKVAACYAIASCVNESELKEEYIIPDAFNKEVSKKVSEAVAKAWLDNK